MPPLDLVIQAGNAVLPDCTGSAVAAAIRAATGLDLSQIPIRPEHITDGR